MPPDAASPCRRPHARGPMILDASFRNVLPGNAPLDVFIAIQRYW
jgi:hypothetical protein